MFNTWKYPRGKGQIENLKTSHDYETARSNQHQACNRCHEKKLKCSGDKGGCERCISHGLACEYRRETSRSKKSRKSDTHSTCSSRSGRDGSGSPGGFHASHTSRLQDRRDNPHSFSSGAESVATGERLYHNGSAHAGYGPHTFDDYQAMPSTTETHASGYPATTAPIGSHAAVGDYAQDTWMLDVSTSAAGIAASFVGTSEAMYSDNAHAFANYSSHTSFDMYQHLDPNDDTRFWPENQNQH